jgi:uncharacterized membrane protein HdeD (DUF308 family)
MNGIVNGLFHNWHLMRILRVVIGISALMEGITTSNLMYGLIGAFFLWQGISNTGCGGNSCQR